MNNENLGDNKINDTDKGIQSIFSNIFNIAIEHVTMEDLIENTKRIVVEDMGVRFTIDLSINIMEE